MNVRELIEELQKYPGDWEVWVMDGCSAPSLQPAEYVHRPRDLYDWYPENVVEIVS